MYLIKRTFLFSTFSILITGCLSNTRTGSKDNLEYGWIDKRTYRVLIKNMKQTLLPKKNEALNIFFERAADKKLIESLAYQNYRKYAGVDPMPKFSTIHTQTYTFFYNNVIKRRIVKRKCALNGKCRVVYEVRFKK